MTQSRIKRRVLVLAALVVLSISAASGGVPMLAAAQSPAEAVEYDEGTIEVILSEAATVSVSNVSVTVNGDPVSTSGYTQTSPRRLEISVGTDVRPIDSATVSFANSPNVDGEVDVEATGVTVDLSNGVAPDRIYAGAHVAIVTSDPDSAIDVLKDGSRVTTRGTGPSSTVYIYDSADSEIGSDYTFVDQDTEKQLTFSVRDLGLSVSAPSSVTTGEPFTVTATANAINRDVEFRLIGSGDEVVDRAVTGLGSNGEATTSLVIADTTATGDYNVVVTDADTGASVTSGTVTATAATTPTPTATPSPAPTDTPTPAPMDTPTSAPTDTPSPPPGDGDTGGTDDDDSIDISVRAPGFGLIEALAGIFVALVVIRRL